MFYRPVDEQGETYGLQVFPGLQDLAEVYLDHDRVHHEKQADGDGDGYNRRLVDRDGEAVQERGDRGGEFAQDDASSDREEHPDCEIPLEKAQSLGLLGDTGLVLH